MSVQRYYPGEQYYFAKKSERTGADATWAGHRVGWGDDGVAPAPAYPLKVVARSGESLPFSMQGRVLKSQEEALGFVQRARSSCVILDDKGRYVGSIYYPEHGSPDRSIVFKSK